jgi:hypothetical protein
LQQQEFPATWKTCNSFENDLVQFKRSWVFFRSTHFVFCARSSLYIRLHTHPPLEIEEEIKCGEKRCGGGKKGFEVAIAVGGWGSKRDFRRFNETLNQTRKRSWTLESITVSSCSPAAKLILNSRLMSFSSLKLDHKPSIVSSN